MSAVVIISSTAAAFDELRSAVATRAPASGVIIIAPRPNRSEVGAFPGNITSGIRFIAVPARDESPARRRLELHVVGRTLLRLSPVDRGRQFARTVGRSEEARDAIAAAGALIAADRDAVLTVWRAARRTDSSVQALFGLAAGTALIRRG